MKPDQFPLVSIATADAPRRVGVRSRHWKAFARFLGREPLLHFCLLGALVFGIDAAAHPPAKDDRVIVVSKALRQSLSDSFDEDKERTPSETELRKRIDNWIAGEILYREGKALAVDRGDDMIRDRVAYKLQLMILDQVRLPEPTETELRGWFAQNHARFDEPERVGFYMTPPSDEATAGRYLEDIEARRETEELRNITQAILARPVDSLAPAFGEAFRDGLLAAPIDRWIALQSKDGWHVVRLDSRREGALAKFEDYREEVVRNWRADKTREQAADAVGRLKASYSVRYEP